MPAIIAGQLPFEPVTMYAEFVQIFGSIVYTIAILVIYFCQSFGPFRNQSPISSALKT